MIGVPPGTRVWLACEPVSMRKGFDGLASEAARVIGADPYSGAVFLFRSRRGDYLKALYWDGSGLVLYAKRLEQGRFVWPAIVNARLKLSPAQLQLLIEGIDWRRTVAPDAPRLPAHV